MGALDWRIAMSELVPKGTSISGIAVLQAPVEEEVPRDITGLEITPELVRDTFFGWGSIAIFAAGAAIIIASVLAVRYWKTKSRRASASARALGHLRRLQSLQLLSKNQAERHFTLLTNIMRRFLEKGYGVAAARATTSEFLTVAARNPLLEKHLSFLREFLSASDIAKFAPPAAVSEIGRDLDEKLREWLSSHSASEIGRRT
jgi:hypothetical protein